MSIITDHDHQDVVSGSSTFYIKTPLQNLDEKIANLKGHIPTWLTLQLSCELNHTVDQLYKILTGTNYLPHERVEVFLVYLEKKSSPLQYSALYLLLSDESIRDTFISFLLYEEFPDYTLQQKVRNILLGEQNQSILQSLYGSTDSLRISELKKTSLLAFGEIFGNIAVTWKHLSSGKTTLVGTVDQWLKHSIFWVKCLYEIDDTANVPPTALVEYLIKHYQKVIIELALYPKDRLLDDKKYFFFHQPLMQLLIYSPKGIELFREILTTYGQSKTWDNKFLNKILFVDKKLPCDQSANIGYLEDVFSKEYALTDECRQFVINSGTCFVPMIARIVKTPPPLRTRFSWQVDLERILSQGKNKSIYESARDHFSWAFHFSEIPSDAFEILDHYLNLETIVQNFLAIEQAKELGDFRLIFDFVANDAKLYHLLYDKNQKFTVEILKSKVVALYQSYLVPPVTRTQANYMKILNPTIKIKSLHRLNQRSSERILSMILRLKSSPHFHHVITHLLSISKHFAKTQHFILAKMIEDSLSRTNMLTLQIFSQMNESELSLFTSYLWKEKILDHSFFSKVFCGATKSPSFPPYQKFVKAIETLVESETIKEALKIKDPHTDERPLICFLLEGRSQPDQRECIIQ